MKVNIRIVFFFLSVIVCGVHLSCNSKSTGGKFSRSDNSPKKLLEVTVGSFSFHDTKPENEEMLDNYELVGYYVDGKYLGDSKQGAEMLLQKLQTIPKGVKIKIQNPATSFIGGMSHQGGIRDLDYKYPIVVDEKLRSNIKRELDRIRGWRHDAKPIGL